MYSVTDSKIHTTAVSAPSTTSCATRPSMPVRLAIMLSSLRTTTSIATPISSSGAMSKILLRTAKTVPRTNRPR